MLEEHHREGLSYAHSPNCPAHLVGTPRLYGGTERVVSFLTEQLVDMGHDVTLFASGDLKTSAELSAVWPSALRFDRDLRDAMAPHLLLLEQVFRRADEFDILHCHLDYWPFSLLSRQNTPFLTTLHGRLDLPELRPIYDCFPDVPLISISDAQRVPLPNANFIATVQHGLPSDLLTPQPVPQAILPFSGVFVRRSGQTGPSEWRGRPASG